MMPVRSPKNLLTMNIRLLASATIASVLAFAHAIGAPLIETTAVHTKPDASSPAISYLKAGTEPKPAANAVADTPAGWMAIELPGPFEGYVPTKDFTKGLDVKPGTPIRLSPDQNSGVLAIAQHGDKTTITGLHGRWTQVSLNQPMIGYINVGGSPGYVPPIANTPASSGLGIPLAGPEAAAPVAAPSNLPGQPAMASTAIDSANLPRQLTGKFVSTRSVLHPRRPYDWALEDNSGKRFAYVDISKLLLTDAIEKYIGHFVVVFGAAKPTADGREIVIQVESLQLLLR
jgi:hypothetical protein